MDEALSAPRKEGATRPPFDELSEKNKIAVLTALVRKQTGAEPAIPEPPKPPEGTSRDDAKAMQQAAAIEYLQQQARSHITVAESEYARLAQDRASAVERALLEGSGLEPTRVFAVRDGKVSAQDGKVQLELQLK
jgi:enterochelin esterase-like enzyme